MKLKFNKIVNNCYYMEINDICICISYESIVGFYDKRNNNFFVSEFYKNYSKTTTRHIKHFENEFSIKSKLFSILFIENDLFNKILSEISEKSISTILNKYIYQNKNFTFE